MGTCIERGGVFVRLLGDLHFCFFDLHTLVTFFSHVSFISDTHIAM